MSVRQPFNVYLNLQHIHRELMAYEAFLFSTKKRQSVHILLAYDHIYIYTCHLKHSQDGRSLYPCLRYISHSCNHLHEAWLGDVL